MANDRTIALELLRQLYVAQRWLAKIVELDVIDPEMSTMVVTGIRKSGSEEVLARVPLAASMLGISAAIDAGKAHLQPEDA